MEPTKKDRARYDAQKANARTRGIKFDLTYKQWWDWWQETGHYHERGPFRGQYVMGRYGDTGPYELGNIYCCTNTENAQFGRRKARKLTDENLAFIRANKGKLKIKEMAQMFGVSAAAVSKVLRGLSYK